MTLSLTPFPFDLECLFLDLFFTHPFILNCISMKSIKHFYFFYDLGGLAASYKPKTPPSLLVLVAGKEIHPSAASSPTCYS